MLWVLESYFQTINTPQVREGIVEFYKTFENLCQNNGRVWASDRVKLSRLILTRRLSGSPLPEPVGMSIDKQGIPNIFNKTLRTLVYQGDPNGYRFLLTLLQVNRTVLGGKPVDLASITNKGEGDWSTLVDHIYPFFSRYKLRGYSPDWVNFHWTSKAGPNGPAMRSCFLEAILLPEDLLEDLKILGRRNFTSVFERLLDFLRNYGHYLQRLVPTPKTNFRLRKLSVKADREAKSRVFAMLDYYSQTVLRPLHELLFRELRKIPSDRTFVQAEGLPVKALPGNSYYSYDLSSATDRFPVDLQVAVLSHLIGQKKAEAWKRVMVGYPFELNGHSYYYGAGQPMGAYSSWAAFTLTHHFVMDYCGRLAGVKPNKYNYAILGDDVVIADDKLAKAYYHVMTEVLKVPISEAKSHVSVDTFEFAKRWFHKGEEITPFPLHGFVENRNRYYLLYDQLIQAGRRGFPFPTPWQPDQFFGAMLKSLGFPARMQGYLLPKILTLHFMPTKDVSEEDLANRFSSICQALNIHIPCWSQKTRAQAFWEASAFAFESQILKEAERIEDHLSDMENQIGQTIDDAFRGSGDQPELHVLADTLPPLQALVLKVQSLMEEVEYVRSSPITVMPPSLEQTPNLGGQENLPNVDYVSTFERAALMEFTPLPKLSGILPDRVHERRLSARSHWAQNVPKAFIARGFPSWIQ